MGLNKIISIFSLRHGQSCGHVGALLFCIAEAVAAGRDFLPDHLTVTDKPCSWLKPKGSQVAPQLVSDLEIKKKINPNRQPPTDRTIIRPDVSTVLRLKGRLLEEGRRMGTDIPAAHLLQAGRFGQLVTEEPIVYTTLKEKLDMLSPEIAISSECEVESRPLPITQFVQIESVSSINDPSYGNKKDAFYNSLASISESDTKHIELLTRGQHENISWYEYKRGAVSASRAQNIYSYMTNGKSNVDRLVNDSVRYDRQGMQSVPVNRIASLKYGVENEMCALNQYEKFAKMELNPFNHPGISISRKGLIVLPDKPYLQCSPDAIMNCNCHGKRLIEVKCPYKARNCTIREAVSRKYINYLQQNANTKKYELKPGSDGYFAQVQMALAITGLSECVFIVWSKEELLETIVEFDSDYWSKDLEPQLDMFFHRFIVPELITGRLKKATEMADKVLQDPVAQSIVSNATDSQSSLHDNVDDNSTLNDTDNGYKCTICQEVLLNEPKFIKDYSIGCECTVCIPQCDVWVHWKCCKPKFTKKHVESGRIWKCSTCETH